MTSFNIAHFVEDRIIESLEDRSNSSLEENIEEVRQVSRMLTVSEAADFMYDAKNAAYDCGHRKLGDEINIMLGDHIMKHPDTIFSLSVTIDTMDYTKFGDYLKYINDKPNDKGKNPFFPKIDLYNLDFKPYAKIEEIKYDEELFFPTVLYKKN